MKKYNFDVCAVNISSLTVFNFLEEGETEEELLERANNYRKENIERYAQLVQEYPDRESFKRYLQMALDSEYQIMSFDEFLKRQRRYYLSLPLREITKEKFEEMFSVLPPLYWCEIDGVEMFCLSEMWTGSYTDQFARVGDKYYTKMVDCRDKTTWINNYLR
jgi:hypothetical protein